VTKFWKEKDIGKPGRFDLDPERTQLHEQRWRGVQLTDKMRLLFGTEVEVDECYLTRRKYHQGRQMKTGTVTLLSLYERATDLGYHLQVRVLQNIYRHQL